MYTTIYDIKLSIVILFGAILQFENLLLDMVPCHIQVTFIAAFANTNEGDVTPDVKGATCTDTGEPCDYVTSTCPSNPTDVRLHSLFYKKYFYTSLFSKT